VKFEAPRGTRDILPGERLWWSAVAAIEEIVPRYGYRRIQTPVFEDTNLIHRTSGAGSDVVQKETYTFEDRGGRSLTLRPEGTAPIVRAYLEHGLHREPKPVKLFTIATMYRFAAPQRGRYREHTQLSAEVIGSADPAVDAELIQLFDEILRHTGVRGYELRLNSIGDQVCRPAYIEALNAWLDEHADVLDEEARMKRATSPLRVFDVKNERVRAALEGAPKIGESLCDECRLHFAQVRHALEVLGVAYVLDPTLVRGLDYYTRTTFEFIELSRADRQQNAIGGGGRYDGLVEQLGGEPTPGIGFGLGLDRLVLALEEAAVTPDELRLDAFIVTEDKEPLLPILVQLRRAGLAVDVDYAGRSRNAQIKHAQRLDPRSIVVVEDGQAVVRQRGREDRRIALGDLVATLTPR